jgi:hypothetical protein
MAVNPAQLAERAETAVTSLRALADQLDRLRGQLRDPTTSPAQVMVASAIVSFTAEGVRELTERVRRWRSAALAAVGATFDD